MDRCSECDGEIGEFQDECPACGEPQGYGAMLRAEDDFSTEGEGYDHDDPGLPGSDSLARADPEAI